MENKATIHPATKSAKAFSCESKIFLLDLWPILQSNKFKNSFNLKTIIKNLIPLTKSQLGPGFVEVSIFSQN